MNPLEELDLKVGPLCRCLKCCCPPGQGHNHPDWIDAWGEGPIMADEQEETTKEMPQPLLPTTTERHEWRRETAIRYVFDLVGKQPEMLDFVVDGQRTMVSTHIEAATRLVEMAAVVETYLVGGD